MTIEKEIIAEEKKIEKSLKSMNTWMIISIVLVIALIGILLYPKFGGVSKDEAGEKLVDFLNTQVVQGGGVELVDVEDKGSLYQINVKYNGQEIPVYTTKDGKYFIQGATEINAVIDNPANSDTTEETPKEVPKSDKPVVELFVWSFCPGGVAGESVLVPSINLFKSKIDAKIRFIGPVTTDKQVAGTSCFASRGKSVDDGANECCVNYTYNGKVYYSCALHNSASNHLESLESERQACILNIAGNEKLGKYLGEFNAKCIAQRTDAAAFESCWKAALKTAGITESAITGCVSSKLGLKYLIEDYAASEKYGGIGSSPTYIINGVEIAYQKSPDELKQNICNSFNTKPAECDQAVTASANSAANTGVSCG